MDQRLPLAPNVLPSSSPPAPPAAVNTTISAAAATVSTLLVSMLHQYLTLGVVVWDLIIAGERIVSLPL